MSLAKRILRFLGISLIIQVMGLGILGYYVFNNKDQSLPPSIIQSLTNIDQKILEGVAFQHKINNETARNLIAYELLELNRVDDVKFLKSESVDPLIKRLELNCREVERLVRLCTKPNNKYIVSFVPVSIQNSIIGYLQLGKSLSSSFVTSKDIFIVIITIIIAFILNMSFILIFWLLYLKPELQKLIVVIRSGVADKTIRSLEYLEIQEKIVENYKRIAEAEKERISLERAGERELIFKQVAHDIRSPLTSLEYLVRNSIVKLEEGERIIAKQSVERINDILSTLGGRREFANNSTKLEIVDLLLKRIISEKRLEFKELYDVEIFFENDLPYGTFVNISKADFYRVMSNLLNNSVEAAIPGKKIVINVCAQMDNKECFIQIKDNGKGIGPEYLSKVLDFGVSFDKPNGTGIGLSHAKETVSNYGGSLLIQSEIGNGTVVSISLPLSDSPSWFKRSLKLLSRNICIIDDDNSIHSIWSEILSKNVMNIVHLTSYLEFKNWIKDVDPSEYIFLFDLELVNSQFNGLEIIKKYSLQERASLVTSHYDDLAVQSQAESLGVKIIPKDAAASVEIEVIESETESIVLIDDDKMMLFHWSSYCKRNGVSFKGFNTIDEFLSESEHFNKEVRIYIDSSLGNGIKGEIESERIYQQGFSNLFLATGYQVNDINKPVWIKKIFSKDPKCIWF